MSAPCDALLRRLFAVGGQLEAVVVDDAIVMGWYATKGVNRYAMLLHDGCGLAMKTQARTERATENTYIYI